MAADYLPINRSKQHGNSCVSIAELILQLRALIDKEYDAANHMINGADYSMLETNFGIASGTGANFATLLGYMQEIFNLDTTVAGADRLARINEFCARIAGQ